ncbi:MAG: sulfatase-like hydrolase/transferase [Acetobacteraceae bacterium]
MTRRGAGIALLGSAAGVFAAWSAAVFAGAWTFATPAAFIAPAVDALFALILTSALLVLLRDTLLGLFLAAVLPPLLLALSTAKWLVLGDSALFSDVSLLVDLARASSLAEVALAGGTAALVLLLVLVSLRLPRRADWPRLLPLALTLALAAAPAAATRAGPAAAEAFSAHLSGLVVADMRLLGQVMYAWMQGARATLAAEQAAPSPPPPAVPVPLEPRSVHIVVVESLTDPRGFPGFALGPGALPARFAAWLDAPAASLLVPVFGSLSSNTEFEILCGLPAGRRSAEVLFRQLRADMALDCLPRRLAEAGFATLALAPNAPGFFNADAAYRALGFANRRFDRDLDMTDRDGIWLSAEATLRQSAAAARAVARPVLNYVFVNASHYPFDRDRARRPDRVDVSPPDALFAAWANAIHWAAVAVEGFVAGVLAEEPGALIVILGDHQPPLGANFAGYRTGGRLPAGDTTPPLSRPEMFETPLILIGEGVEPAAGRLPAWALPDVILDILSRGEHCRRSACAHHAEAMPRPFRSQVMAVPRDGGAVLRCGPSERAGRCADAWREADRLAGHVEWLLSAGRGR